MTLSPLICAFLQPPDSAAKMFFAIVRICLFAAGWILFVVYICNTKKKIIFALIYWSFLILSFLYMFLFVNFNFTNIVLMFILLITSVLIFPFSLSGEILSGIGLLGKRVLNIELSYIVTLALMITFAIFIIYKLNKLERKNDK